MHLLNYSLHKAIPNSLLVRSGTLGGNGFFSDCLILKNPIEPLQNPLQIKSAQSILQKHIYELTTGRYGPIHFVTESEVQTLYQVTRSKSISPFEILTVSKDEAFLLFGNNPFALLQILDTKTESVQIIRSGDFVDFYLCSKRKLKLLLNRVPDDDRCAPFSSKNFKRRYKYILVV
jgi:hypothetical protein